MPVEIQELHAEVEVTDPASVLTPEVLAQVVDAVIAELGRRSRASGARAEERDLRSVVQRQRGDGQSTATRGGGSPWPS